MNAVMLQAQVDPRALAALERMALAQTVMAVIMLLIGLVVLFGFIAVFLQLRASRRAMERTMAELKPQLAPLIDRAKHVTDDLAGMANNVRHRADDVLHTVEDLRRAAERGGVAVEERLRRFTAVLDVVQAETEELMLDAAATAHGLQKTARVLREQQEAQPGRRHRKGGDNPAPPLTEGPDDNREETRNE